MKHKHFVILYVNLLIVLMLIFQGCYAPRETTAEILYPAEKENLVANMDSVAMINRSYLPDSERKKSGIRYKGSYYEKSEQYIDSIVSDNALYTFSYLLNIAPKGNTVKNDTIVKIPPDDNEFLQPLPRQQVNRLCQTLEANSLLSLETFHSFDSLYFNTSEGYYLAERKTTLMTVWRVYGENKNRPLYQTYLGDTLYFSSYGYSRNSAYEDLISYKDALYEISYSSGMKFLQQIAPHWKEVDRIYFDYYTNDMTKANRYASKGLWLKATQIWKPVAEKERGAKSAYAAYNMAFAAEMRGNLEMAVFWIDKALNMKPDNYYFLGYHQVLKDRVERQKIVEQQLEAF